MFNSIRSQFQLFQILWQTKLDTLISRTNNLNYFIVKQMFGVYKIKSVDESTSDETKKQCDSQRKVRLNIEIHSVDWNVGKTREMKKKTTHSTQFAAEPKTPKTMLTTFLCQSITWGINFLGKQN